MLKSVISAASDDVTLKCHNIRDYKTQISDDMVVKCQLLQHIRNMFASHQPYQAKVSHTMMHGAPELTMGQWASIQKVTD